MSRCGFSVPAVPKCVHFELTPLTINEEYQSCYIILLFKNDQYNIIAA